MSLTQLLERAGLTGRGGAAFSTALKIQAASDTRASLIVNACDGELGAAKDSYVVAAHLDELRHGAHLVTNEIQYAAHRGSETESRLLAAGLTVLPVPDRYVASEESALVSLAHGGLGRPVTKPRPVVYGLRDSGGRRLRPTVVLNAETVWRISQIASHGPEWFRAQGTPAEPGPRLVAVGGSVSHPGVFEVEAGMQTRDILGAAGAYDVGAVAIGGLSGGFLSAVEACRTAWDTTQLGAFGCRIGSGVLHVLSASACPLAHVLDTLDYASGESAGQCGPCMFGVPAVAADFETLVSGRLTADDVQRLRGRVGMLAGRGACRFPDGVAGYVRSALRVFDTHLLEHSRGRCPEATVTRARSVAHA